MLSFITLLQVPEVPLVVDDSAESVTKTARALELITKVCQVRYILTQQWLQRAATICCACRPRVARVANMLAVFSLAVSTSSLLYAVLLPAGLCTPGGWGSLPDAQTMLAE